MTTEQKDLRERLRTFGAFWELIAKDSGLDPKPIVDMLEEAARQVTPIDSSQQATLNRTRDVLVEYPLAKVATVVAFTEKAETIFGSVPMVLIDYGDVDPIDLVRVAGLMLRRAIKGVEADPASSETEKLVITRELLKAIAALPLDLGEEQKDGVQVARNAETMPIKES